MTQPPLPHTPLRPSLSAPGQILVSVLLLLGAALVSQACLMIRGAVEPGSGSPAEVERLLQCHAAACLAVIYATWRLQTWFGPGTGVPWTGQRGVRALPTVVGSYVALLVVWVPFTWFVYLPALTAMGFEAPVQDHLAYFTAVDHGPAFWVVVATVCVLGPVAEEIVFRGFLQTALGRLLPRLVSIAITAALFGLIHGPLLALPLAIVGVWFCWLRERDTGLIAPVCGHVLHNTVITTTVILWPELFELAYGK